ncbi:MAG: S41 family peptidase [Thermoflavifilum aggregans]|nr:S41 family peptidase [Thermoflavifilum aggregans]
MIFRKNKWKMLGAGLLLGLAGMGIWALRTDDKYFEIIKSLDIYASVLRDLNTYYVDSLSPFSLMRTSVDAMTGSLDPYTTFYPQEDVGDLTFQTTGKYGGTGISIRREDDHVLITDVLQDSPAGLAGLRPGDRIENIDGRDVDSLSEDTVSNLLRGVPGTSVIMRIYRPYLQQRFTVKLVRAEIGLRSVPYAFRLADGVGYIRLQQFTQGCSRQVKQALDSLKNIPGGLQGLIIDLRGNPGGLLEEAVKTANLFIDPGQTIVSIRGRIQAWNQTYRTTERADDDSIPLAVLINHQSASAAEILAGALQDLDRAVIIGQRSYGKGLVQTTYDLPYDTKMKITTARYYTPSGRCIQAVTYSHQGDILQQDYIPDSLRQSYKTAHGRIVKGGGGIEPDIPLRQQHLSEIAEDLLIHHMIFDYATRYFYAHEKPASPDNLILTDRDYTSFLEFLQEKNYHFQSNASQLLDQFTDQVQMSGWWEQLRQQTDSLRRTLNQIETKQLLAHREEIMQLLKAEIADRYWPQQGEWLVSLQSDEIILKTIHILRDQKSYRALLMPASSDIAHTH